MSSAAFAPGVGGAQHESGRCFSGDYCRTLSNRLTRHAAGFQCQSKMPDVRIQSLERKISRVMGVGAVNSSLDGGNGWAGPWIQHNL